MKKHKVIFRADGGTTIGMGHIVRCLSLAAMLKEDFDISFAIQQTDESVLETIKLITTAIHILPATSNYSDDAISLLQHAAKDATVVMDGYHFETEYQKTLKISGCKLVCIDDLHAWHFIADAIINHADGISLADYSLAPHTKFYSGLNYVLLRPAFLATNSTNKKISIVKTIFISMGAADSNNLTQKFTEALLQIKGVEKVQLMVGAINPNLKSVEQLIHQNKQVNITTHFNISANELSDLLKECDVAICPASSISLECCSIGIGLISGYTAANQIGILDGLTKHKAAIDVGDMNTLSVDDIRNRFTELFEHPEFFNALMENQKKMIDGKSPERLKNIFKKLAKERLHFRFANAFDVDLYFRWANDSLVRANSYNQHLVNYNEHVKWFTSKLVSNNCYFYLFSDADDEYVGQVRIDKNGNEIIIGISIDEKYRGKSFGVEMLMAATENYLQRNYGSTITAYIKKENAASYKIFLKAEFGNEEMVLINGIESYKLYKN